MPLQGRNTVRSEPCEPCTPPENESSFWWSTAVEATSTVVTCGSTIYLNDAFSGKMSIFTPKISDDLFFNHRPGLFRFCVVYCDRMSYTTLSSQEKPLF